MSTIERIDLVHHSHTDIGYTHDQPVLWELERRFIDAAIDLAERDADLDAPEAFRWTVETTGPLLRWLETADEADIERLQELESAGRIEITGMLANITPLYGPVQTIESLRPLKLLREEYGFDVKYAMNCDVNGQNWPLVDRLIDAGIEGFWMGVNVHFGGAPLERPNVFRWEGPSGRSIPVYNGYQYGGAYQMGIGRDLAEFREEWWPRIEDRLDAVDYSLSAFRLNFTYWDNHPPFEPILSFVEEWNDQEAVADGELPEMRLATPSEWWDRVEAEDVDLPVHSGDWTDFWNFGSVSSAYETGVNRESRRRLRTADRYESVLSSLGSGRSNRPVTRRSPEGTRDDAWWATNFYDEHTWGADTSIRAPDSDDVRSQWNHQANYAYEAKSKSQLLRRDALAELARRVETEEVGR